MDDTELHQSDYHSYLLRLWGNAGQSEWRASLQPTGTKQIQYFASMEALVAFLVTQMAATGDEAGAGQNTVEIGMPEARSEV